MSQFKHLLRVALLALPLLLLLGLNGRMVTLLRPVAAGSPASLSPRATVIKQRVVLEAASPLAAYVAPLALGWLPAILPSGWLPRLGRRAAAAVALVGAPGACVAQQCRQRLLAGVLRAQAP